jgi:hypothetical protein
LIIMATNNEHGFYAPQPPAQPAPAQTAQDPKGNQQQPNQQSYGNLYQYPNAPPQVAYPQFYRPPVPYSKGWGFTKDGFQAASVVICIIGIGMSAALGNNGYGSLLINLPIFVFAFVWGACELFLRFRRKFARPAVHPGAHVALSLIIWLAAGFAGGIQATLDAVYRSRDWDNDCWNDETEDYDGPCGPRWGGQQGLYTGVAVLLCLLCIIHFILFVGACSDTAKHNAAARAQVMIVPPVWGPPAQGYQPMPFQQQYQQYQQYPQQPQHQQGQEQIPMGARNSEHVTPSVPTPAATTH